MKFVDPDGNFVNIAAAGCGALLGAGTGAVIALASGSSGREIAAAAIGGAVSGAFAGFTLGGSVAAQAIGSVAIGAASSVAGNLVTNSIAGEKIDAKSIGKSALAGAIGGAVGFGVAKAVSAVTVQTKQGLAIQSFKSEAASAKTSIKQGATLYRGGTLGRSAGPEGQYWSLENPLSSGYANKYGIPAENISNMDFIETGTLKHGANVITRPAPGVGTNLGGGIEAVVPPGSVKVNSFITME